MKQANSGSIPAHQPGNVRRFSARSDQTLSTDPKSDGVRIDVSAARITSVLFSFVAALVIASASLMVIDYLTGYNSVLVHKLVKLFSVDLELNVPSFFSSLLLLFASALLGVITVVRHKERAADVLHWASLSAGFLFLAFDETISVHERLIEPVRAILGEANLGILYFAWVVPAIVMIVALSAFFLRFLLNLPREVAFWFLVAATLYLGAAVGLELAEGKHVEVFGKDNFLYQALATTEETLEMVGIVVFIRVLLLHIAQLAQDLHFSFGIHDTKVLWPGSKSHQPDRSDAAGSGRGSVSTFEGRTGTRTPSAGGPVIIEQ